MAGWHDVEGGVKTFIIAKGKPFFGVLFISTFDESLDVGGTAGEEFEPGVGDERWFALDVLLEYGGECVVEDPGED